MKRRMKLVTGILLFAAGLSVTANAGSLELDSQEFEEKSFISDINDLIRDEMPERGVFDVGSSDIVTIADDESLFTVKNPIISMSITPPFGWICLTQDIGAQLDVYMAVYKDPVLGAEAMVENGVHFTLLNSDISAVAEVKFYDDTLGSIIANSADLTASDEESVISMLSGSVFPGYDIEAVTIGNYRFYRIKNPEKNQCIYETYVNGICIDTVMYSFNDEPLTEYDLADIEYMLSLCEIG